MRFLLSILMLLIVSVPGVFAQEAILEEVNGRVEVQRPGSSWMPAEPGMVITEDTTISTGFGAAATVAIGDATIQVSPLTRLSLSELVERGNTTDTTLSLRVGRIETEVRNTSGRENNFQVRGPYSTAAVRGTRWVQTISSVDVIDGTVAVYLGPPPSRADTTTQAQAEDDEEEDDTSEEGEDVEGAPDEDEEGGGEPPTETPDDTGEGDGPTTPSASDQPETAQAPEAPAPTPPAAPAAQTAAPVLVSAGGKVEVSAPIAQRRRTAQQPATGDQTGDGGQDDGDAGGTQTEPGPGEEPRLVSGESVLQRQSTTPASRRPTAAPPAGSGESETAGITDNEPTSPPRPPATTGSVSITWSW